MKKVSITLLSLFLLISVTQVRAQVTISGVTLPSNLKMGSTTLVLNGGGVRVKFFMDMYVAGLYLPAKSADANAIVKADNPTSVRLNIVSSMVTTDRMKEAIAEGFKKSTGGNTAPIQAKIDKFVNLFSLEPITKGNLFELNYTPGVGVVVAKNGKVLATIDGLDFKTALWGIWLGNDPADKGLKTGLLGGK
jgi:hypothetical protein